MGITYFSDLNETIDGYEFYDHVNKTTFLYVDKNNGNQSFRSKMAFDYQNNQTFILNGLLCVFSEFILALNL